MKRSFSLRIITNWGFHSFELFVCFRDELGTVVAWRKSGREIIEYENIHSIHLESSSITTVSAVRINDFTLIVYVQVKSGYIYAFNFNETSGFAETGDPIPCGTFTFCRMSVLKLNGTREEVKILLSYPSSKVENAIDILEIQGDYRCYLLKDFMVQNSGMCLFTKLKKLKDSRIILICGYESGKLVVANCGDGQILIEEKCFEDGESCTDADLYEGIEIDSIKLVVVGTGKTVKVIKGFDSPDPSLTSLTLPFPGCNSVSIRFDGKLFVTGGWDCKLRFFSLKSLKLLAVVDYHYEAISAVEIRREDSSTIAACSDGTISVWTLF